MNPLQLALILSPLSLVISGGDEGASRLPFERPALVWGDFNGDGARDAFAVQPDGSVVLLASQGDGTLQDVTQRVGLGDLSGVRQALWQDVDGDRLPELYLVVPTGASKLLRYEGSVFTDVTQAAGLALDTAVLYAEWLAMDGDALGDLHLSTARGELVLQNLGGTQFLEIDLGLAGVEVPWSVHLAGRTQPADAAPPLRAARPSIEGSSAAMAGATVAGGTPAGSRGQWASVPFCYDTIEDQATGNCVMVSSTPTLGSLYPLSQDWFVDGGSGNVGLGTTSPAERLHVDGNLRVDQGSLLARNSADVQTVRLRPDGSGLGGELSLSNNTGVPLVTLKGENGEVRSKAADGSVSELQNGAVFAYNTLNLLIPTATLRGPGPNDGGSLELKNDGSKTTVELLGDAGSDEAHLILRDASSGLPVDGVALHGRNPSGPAGGGVVSVLNGEGQVSARLLGDNGGDQGRLLLYEGDGSYALSAGGDLLRGFDSDGAQTYSLDRQSGTAIQPVDGDGFLKAALVINGNTGALVRSFNHLSTNLTVQRVSEGLYNIQFVGTDVTNRYFDVSLISSGVLSASAAAVSDIVSVKIQRPDAVFVPIPPPGVVHMTAPNQDANFTLFVY